MVTDEGTGAPGLDARLGLVVGAEEAPCEDPPLDLPPEKVPLPVRPLHEAPVLLGPAGQVGQHLVHWAVGHVLVDREAGLTWRERGWSGKYQERKKKTGEGGGRGGKKRKKRGNKKKEERKRRKKKGKKASFTTQALLRPSGCADGARDGGQEGCSSQRLRLSTREGKPGSSPGQTRPSLPGQEWRHFPPQLSTESLGTRRGEWAEVTRSPGNVGSQGWANSRSIQPETSS